MTSAPVEQVTTTILRGAPAADAVVVPIPALLEQRSRDSSARAAVEGESGALTFGELYDNARRLASALDELGCGAGEVVAVHLSNQHAAEMFLSFSGATGNGSLFAPLSTRTSGVELRRLLDLLRPKLVISAGPEAIQEAAGDAPPAVWDVAELRRQVSGARAKAFPSLSADQDAAILCTSGTTGTPKGAIYTHAEICRVAERTLSIAGPEAALPEMRPGDLYQVPLPLYTSSGVLNVMSAVLYRGLSALIEPRFAVTECLRLLEERRARLFFAVPAMLVLLMEAARPRAAAPGVTLTGGAPIPAELVARLDAAWPGTTLVNNYGSTEAGGAGTFACGAVLRAHPGSVGYPLAGCEVRIVARYTETAHEGIGDVEVRGPGVMRGFLDNPDATAEAISPDGWIKVGDLGRIAGGLLYLAGRKHDMIIRGGFNIMPREVEAALEAHDAVLEAGVVAREHPVLGEDLVAFVVPRPNSRAPSPDELRHHCLKRLADYKAPRDIRVTCEPLPRNSPGKLLRAELLKRVA